jgi:hypothetical protein
MMTAFEIGLLLATLTIVYIGYDLVNFKLS